ncbi:hypothetical protein ACFSL6_06875 [Paenibacillus thailandensis]|uniref:hypothetical protein n=1 Tax=Paenibacillus thailandensis TaxID=393250 RepID=UPI00363F153C
METSTPSKRLAADDFIVCKAQMELIYDEFRAKGKILAGTASKLRIVKSSAGRGGEINRKRWRRRSVSTGRTIRRTTTVGVTIDDGSFQQSTCTTMEG